MSVGTLTGTLTTPLILGQGQYGDQLFIATGAAVEVARGPAVTYESAAITGPSNLVSATIVNDGTLEGVNSGYGFGFSSPGVGGAGILLHGSGDVVNAGAIYGGMAGPVTSGPGYGFEHPSGGDGVDLSAGGTLANSGMITGGNNDARSRWPGGEGVLLGAAGSVTNSGTMTGGNGSSPGLGGAGIAFQAGGTLTNTGHIVAGYDARAAAVFNAAASVTNSGTIDGFSSAAGVALSDGGVLENTGVIAGGVGAGSNIGYYQINGRAGLLVDGTACIYNGDQVSGGAGGNLAWGNAGLGAGGSGGIGIVLQGSGSIVDNAGTFTGGAGGYAEFSSSGNGGVGAVVSSGNLLVSNGNIIGGAGGANGGLVPGRSAPGGAGGAGAVVLGGELFNLGVITGGDGGASIAQSGGAGGAGVFIGSGKLVAAAGTISGGAAASGYAGPSIGPAVAFGNHLPGTLVVDPGAVFVGGIEASTLVADTLVLAGTAPGSLGGFGQSGGIRNVSDVSERAGAQWTLTGNFTNSENLSIGANAFLELDGPVTGSTIGFAQSGGDTLCLDTPASFSGTLSALGSGDAIQLTSIYATSFAYGGSLLSLLGSNGDTLSTLKFAGTYASSDFHLESIAGGTQIDFNTGSH